LGTTYGVKKGSRGLDSLCALDLCRCTFGHTVRVQLYLTNPATPVPAAALFVSASVCFTPFCRTGLTTLPGAPAKGPGVLSGSAPCDIGADPCGLCGGDGSYCAGCDGKPNSGAVADLCGVCGGANACVGCDNVVGSNATFDTCGVCGGSNACITSIPLDGHVLGAWPSVAVNLSVAGVGVPAERLGPAGRTKIKGVLAASVQINPASVDLVSLRDIVVSARRAAYDYSAPQLDPAEAGEDAGPNDDGRGAAPGWALAIGGMLSPTFARGESILRHYLRSFLGLNISGQHPLPATRRARVCTAERAAWSGCRVGTGVSIAIAFIPPAGPLLLVQRVSLN
jgi:hypothetical protein